MALLADGCAGYELYAGYGLYPPPAPGAPQVVAVAVREFEIDPWPRLLRKGRVVFDLLDEGALAHALVLEGPGGPQRLGEEVTAGERQQVRVDLKPGLYRLYCPDGNHSRLGMTARVEVVDDVGWFRR